jgi:hypothetical protein
MQPMPAAQVLLHVPQFFGSICVLVQMPLQQEPLQQPPLQNDWPGWQKSTHLPPVQLWLAVHALPHAPQFFVSVCVSVHVVPHSICVPEQPPPVHMLLTQFWPVVQLKPQAPQLNGLFVRLMHE